MSYTPKAPKQMGITPPPRMDRPRPRPSEVDRERELWAAGKSAFWLHPDRWVDVPIDDRGHLEPFWMSLE